MGNIANFTPSKQGLHYINTWPDVPLITASTPFGPINVGDAAGGLCGGMSFAVRDLYEAGRLPPEGTDNPKPNTGAFHYLVNRLITSFGIPFGVAQIWSWMKLPDGDTNLGFITLRGLGWRTANGSMPALRDAIDKGHPAPLILIRAKADNPTMEDLGKNHQVLAYGYEDTPGETRVFIYDPNHPGQDDIVIRFDPTDPAKGIALKQSTGEPLFGFFVNPYGKVDPTPLFANGNGTGGASGPS